jgi:hypothetical protein
LFPWVAANPEKVALYGIAFYYERQLTVNITKGAIGVFARSIVGGTGPGIIRTTASALATRWPLLRTGFEGVKGIVKKHPVAIVGAAYLATAGTAIVLAQDEDARIQEAQVRATSQGIGGTGQPGLGGYSLF